MSTLWSHARPAEREAVGIGQAHKPGVEDRHSANAGGMHGVVCPGGSDGCLAIPLCSASGAHSSPVIPLRGDTRDKTREVGAVVLTTTSRLLLHMLVLMGEAYRHK